VVITHETNMRIVPGQGWGQYVKNRTNALRPGRYHLDMVTGQRRDLNQVVSERPLVMIKGESQARELRAVCRADGMSQPPGIQRAPLARD
jgi:hypothetical protein